MIQESTRKGMSQIASGEKIPHGGPRKGAGKRVSRGARARTTQTTRQNKIRKHSK
jgi:hypothetical protein